MPFRSRGLPIELQNDVQIFINDKDLGLLYSGYDWGNDNWIGGYRDIVGLEKDISESVKNGIVSRRDIENVAKWGNLRNPKRISCPEKMSLYMYDDRKPTKILEDDPIIALLELSYQIESGFGPTYLSKVLRFACPQEYGAIDTRIVRIFGEGDSSSREYDWLSLKVRNYGYGWFIDKNQSAWPDEYGTWINILRLLSNYLNESDISCPHPKKFYQEGLREEGKWFCADVEMALFTYASQHII